MKARLDEERNANRHPFLAIFGISSFMNHQSIPYLLHQRALLSVLANVILAH